MQGDTGDGIAEDCAGTLSYGMIGIYSITVVS